MKKRFVLESGDGKIEPTELMDGDFIVVHSKSKTVAFRRGLVRILFDKGSGLDDRIHIGNCGVEREAWNKEESLCVAKSVLSTYHATITNITKLADCDYQFQIKAYRYK